MTQPARTGKTVRSPDVMNSIEIEASINPITLEMIFIPVIPNFLEINVAILSITKIYKEIAIIIPLMAIKCINSLDLWEKMIIVDIAPGPAIRGIARGTTAISLTLILFFFASFNSLLVFLAFGILAFNILIAINKSNIPPAILKEEIEIPKKTSIYWPIHTEISPAIPAENAAVLAVSFFSWIEAFDVSDTKMGIAAKGEKIVTIPIAICM